MMAHNLCRRHLVQLLHTVHASANHALCHARPAVGRPFSWSTSAHASTRPRTPSLNGFASGTGAQRPARSLPAPPLSFVPPPTSRTPWAQVTTAHVAQAIARAHGYAECTPVQSAVHRYLTPGGPDAVIRAPTGSGKTLAFLAPALAHITEHAQAPKKHKGPRVLVLSPTRELAQQTWREADKLIKSADAGSVLRKVAVASVIPAAKNPAEDKARLPPGSQEGSSDLVVATPGKLLDALAQQPQLFVNLDMLILDEADRLLDANFVDQVSTILSHLPSSRQTLMFSATYSDGIRALAASALRPRYHAVSTIPVSEATPLDAIRQLYSVTTMAHQPALLHALLHRSVLAASAAPNRPPFKVMVFLPTVALTSLYASLFATLFDPDFLASTAPSASKQLRPTSLPQVLALHSDLSPASRARVSGLFNDPAPAQPVVLFTSDISARGMDYTGVQLVVQLGMPSGRDTYVHRVGRTARGVHARTGGGVAWTVLMPMERAVVLDHQLSGVPLVQAHVVNGCAEGIELDGAHGRGGKGKWDGASSARLVRVAVAQGAVGTEDVAKAYLSMLGYYENHLPKLVESGMSSYSVVKELDAFASALGLKTLPKLPQGLCMAFGDAQEKTVDKRVHAQGKVLAKGGVRAGVSKKLLRAVAGQHRNNQAKMLAGTKRRRAVLDNEFAYRP